MPFVPQRPRATLLMIVVLWVAVYASFALFTPPLLDDADSVHAEVAREMLLRHDYVTLYANGIRYLEKAPLMYWSMAACMRVVQAFGAGGPDALAAAARFPIALTVLGLALIVEAFARRAFRSARAGLYAALITLSSFGIFLFTRITIPDAGVCLWTALAMYAFWHTEEDAKPGLAQCFVFALACALNVLTKGLIGLVFPVAIVGMYLLMSRGLRGAWVRVGQLHVLGSLLVFLAIAAPWHVLAGLANSTQGHPAAFHFVNGHWQVPLPSDGNVRGWFWFYFMNEHLLRYLNLRVPHDYDTVPLYVFWGLCFVWLMPWSAFILSAAYRAAPLRSEFWRNQFRKRELPLLERARLLFLVWATFVLLFFSLSTRQEYYVLPALPAASILIAGWLEIEVRDSRISGKYRSAQRAILFWAAFGCVFGLAAISILLHPKPHAANVELATLLQQNPGEYAMSMGHFLDLNADALSMFRFPLMIAVITLLAGPGSALVLRRLHRRPQGYIALATGAFGFLIAAHMGLRTFSHVLTSAQLAKAIAPQVKAEDLIAIHGEYEAGSTLGFYLQRNDVHILEGRSSNLWYGSFFPDAPKIFETPETIAQKWAGPRRVFMWQSITDEPRTLPALPGTVYVIASGGGKEIVSNQPNR